MGGVILNDDAPEKKRQEALLVIGNKYLGSISMQNVYEAWLEASRIPGSMGTNALHCLLKDLTTPAIEAEYASLASCEYHTLSQVRPEASTVLEYLSKTYSLGVMANQSEQTVQLLEQAGLLQFFAHQKMSAHVGQEKPNPLFYQTILAECAVGPSESVLIDDNWYRGLAPAKALGIKTILFERPIIPFPESADPDFHISSLLQLQTIL